MGGIRGHSRALRVLIVDDSDADRMRFSRALSGAGYEVHAAEDGSQAWARLQEQRFDVLVSDRQMPGTDGLELTRLVRASRAHARIPVIMVSGMDAPSDRAAGLAAGAAEYICKTNAGAAPVLLDTVERLTRTSEGEVRANPLFERALIVEGSSVARRLLSRTLRPYCAAITAVAGIAEARAHFDEGGVSLVVLDATVEGALAWLEERCAWTSRPAFVVVTSRPSHDEETRVSLLGAIGYLAKPIAARELSHVLVRSRG
jgi:DNA-binding response OmpR family regulator